MLGGPMQTKKNPDIVLSTLNATYHHTAFGLRYLYANLAEFQPQTKIVEFMISQNPRDIAQTLYSLNPKVIGIGVYIWNTEPTLKLISILKKILPETLIVLGGPEVSYENETQEICRLADYVFCQEGDFAFYKFCKNYFEKGELPKQKIIKCETPDIKKIKYPYAYYSDEDIQNRILYVEASRGCPFKCEFCLSSLDTAVRNFEIESFLGELKVLIERGARKFKFVDRTFNLSPLISQKILNFFLGFSHLDLFLHFELVPDRLPAELKELIQRFPAGSLQFEIGIQTWSEEVSKNISRRQNYPKIIENLKFLNESTGVHLHTDLIVGLPGETVESFGKGFDQLIHLGPQEIQVGILKRLKGTPIIRHNCGFEMVYDESPPFQILKTKHFRFEDIQALTRFSKFWDLIGNSGNFNQTLLWLKQLAADDSFFRLFFRLSEFLSQRHSQRHSIALVNLFESVFLFLREELAQEEKEIKKVLTFDYTNPVQRSLPAFLKQEEIENRRLVPATKRESNIPDRQRRHLTLH